MIEERPDWSQRYLDGDTPWDSEIRSRELARVLDEGLIAPCRAVELGCGTGTNAVYLAEQGFNVTAIDTAPPALDRARALAEAKGVAVEFLEADLCDFALELEPFDFVFDRGCYHCARRIDLPGFLQTLSQLSRPGSKWLTLTGNADEDDGTGIPRVSEEEIRADLGGLFDVDFIRAIHFEDVGGIEGPLGWSCLMKRKGN